MQLSDLIKEMSLCIRYLLVLVNAETLNWAKGKGCDRGRLSYKWGIRITAFLRAQGSQRRREQEDCKAKEKVSLNMTE